MNRKINHGTIEKINYYNIYKNIHDIKFQSKFIKIALNFFYFYLKIHFKFLNCSIVKSNKKCEKYFFLYSKETNMDTYHGICIIN